LENIIDYYALSLRVESISLKNPDGLEIIRTIKSSFPTVIEYPDIAINLDLHSRPSSPHLNSSHAV